MSLVHWEYAAINISVVFLVWLYVGTANPAVKPGLAAEFHFLRWLKNAILRLCGLVIFQFSELFIFCYSVKIGN